jgi:hypothetical protein
LTRHEFLAQLHELLRPATYLEVGVQAGGSLALAAYSQLAIGVDPYPLINQSGNQQIYPVFSREFFGAKPDLPPVDLAFIDGSHLFEDALWDFAHIEKYLHAKSVVVFDDILPYNEAIANREQPPGDWTGDVWKCTHALLKHRPDLTVFEVNTLYTGSLLVYGFGNGSFFRSEVEKIITEYINITGVPPTVLDRTYALTPEDAIKELTNWQRSL